jgi:6-phosphogluconolactonase
MQRRAFYVAALACAGALSSLGCGTDSGARTGGLAGSGGQTAAGASPIGGSSSISVAGSSVGGQAPTGGAASAGTSAGGNGSGGGGSGNSAGAAGGPAKSNGTPLVYLGGTGDFPLRVYALDKTTGALSQKGGDEDGGNSPSYLALAPSGQYLYNANEDDGNTAGVTAHHIKADGTLEPLNHQQGTDKSCGGSCGFTHVAVDPSGKYVMGANYDGGSVSVFPINPDGSLGAEKQMLDFGGKAEAHSVGFDPTGKFVFVPTLGLDQVQQLKLGADGTLSPNSPPDVASAGNAGPRHIAMHPSGKLAFVINETASTLTPYAISADGKLTAGSTVSSLPQGVMGEAYGQHLKLSPDGHFLYCSNVGHDSLGVFSVDQNSGALGWLQDQPSGGAWPRDFDVDPNGELLVAANRDSNSLTVFKIGTDGKLTPLGQPTTVPDQPTSVVIRYQP